MKTLSRYDVRNALITGGTTGILGWLVLRHVGHELSPLLILVPPALWLAGVQLGYVLGQWVGFFDQFGKFAAIGLTNFAVDTGVLNLLIFLTGIAGGAGFAIWKSISFVVAVTHSYIWNNIWTFETKGNIAKFFAVMIASWLVNVSVASLVLHSLTTTVGHANTAAIIGSAVALIFSFIGFRLVVFKHAV